MSISCGFTKKFLHLIHYIFVNFKFLPFIGASVVSNIFVGNVVVQSSLMDYFDTITEENPRISTIVRNLHDGLSSLLFVIVSQISEVYTGPFIMIIICTSATIQGLLLLWASTSSSTFYMIYAAIVFLTFLNSSQILLDNYLEYNLDKKIKMISKDMEVEHRSTQKKEKQQLKKKVVIEIGLFGPILVGFVLTIVLAFSIFNDAKYVEEFRFATLLNGGAYMLFLLGFAWYSHEKFPILNNRESKLHKIYRTCKAAFGNRKSKYPTSKDCYYWKGYKQEHCDESGEGVRLLPQVPRLFRWLDKAAITKSNDSKDLETQEKNGKLCMVKEVREVKSLVPMIYLCFSLFAYSLLLATGNTFFVVQASNMTEAITDTGNDISVLFLIKDATFQMSRFICFLIGFVFKLSRKFKAMDCKSKRKVVIARVGFGMVCAIICSLVAWKVELRRLKVIKEMEYDTIHNKTVALVPQYSLLGMTEGLVDGGFSSLFQLYVAESMWTFKQSFSEFVIGCGKLFILPLVLIIPSLFSEDVVHASKLDKFYLMLGILNTLFLFIFVYYSFTYTYKGLCPEDHEIDSEDYSTRNVGITSEAKNIIIQLGDQDVAEENDEEINALDW